jgi:two-component system response regulator CssR
MPTLSRSRVLCVDDDLDACEILGLLLNSCGIDSTCAQSAADAWPLIKQQCFDLYLLDGWLPGIDGFEFCRQIREFDSKTPILFYSGAAYDADKQKGIEAGANAYVAKPDVDGLIETIVDLIAKAKTPDVVATWVGNQRQPQRTRSMLNSSASLRLAIDADADQSEFCYCRT